MKPLTEVKVVYTPGVWDLLHIGHVRFLEKAAELGELLVVGVADDTIVKEDKRRLPIIPTWARCEMLSSLDCVDLVYPYTQLEFISALDQYKPKVFAVGEFWGKEERHTKLESELVKRNIEKVVIPYSSIESSTKIKDRIIDQRLKENLINPDWKTNGE